MSEAAVILVNKVPPGEFTSLVAQKTLSANRDFFLGVGSPRVHVKAVEVQGEEEGDTPIFFVERQRGLANFEIETILQGFSKVIVMEPLPPTWRTVPLVLSVFTTTKWVGVNQKVACLIQNLLLTEGFHIVLFSSSTDGDVTGLLKDAKIETETSYPNKTDFERMHSSFVEKMQSEREKRQRERKRTRAKKLFEELREKEEEQLDPTEIYSLRAELVEVVKKANKANTTNKNKENKKQRSSANVFLIDRDHAMGEFFCAPLPCHPLIVQNLHVLSSSTDEEEIKKIVRLVYDVAESFAGKCVPDDQRHLNVNVYVDKPNEDQEQIEECGDEEEESCAEEDFPIPRVKYSAVFVKEIKQSAQDPVLENRRFLVPEKLIRQTVVREEKGKHIVGSILLHEPAKETIQCEKTEEVVALPHRVRRTRKIVALSEDIEDLLSASPQEEPRLCGDEPNNEEGLEHFQKTLLLYEHEWKKAQGVVS